MTRTEIETLAVGDQLQSTLDVLPGTEFTRLRPNARFGNPRKVVEITARGVSVNGKAYVIGYMEHGPNGSISFSIGEGEMMYRKV